MAYAAYHVRPDARTAASNWSGSSASVSDNASGTYAYPTKVFGTGTATYTLGTATITGIGTSTFVYGVRPIGIVGPTTMDGSLSIALSGQGSTSTYLGSTYLAVTISTAATVARDTAGVVTVTVANTFAVNDYVLITGVTPTWANGTWLVTSASATQFTFQHPETTSVGSANFTVAGTAYRMNLVGGFQYLDSSNALWSQTAVDNLAISCSGFPNDTTNQPRLYELWGEVTVYDLPSITLTGIGNDSASPWAPTDTSTPLVTWTYSQTQNAPQTGVVMKLFSTTTTTPETTTPLWSTTVIDGSTSAQITYSMTNGTSYYLYYKVASGGNGAQNYGAWSSAVTITPSLTAPTIPTISSATYSSSTEKVTIALSGGAAYTGATQTWQLQRSDDGGTTYYDVRGCTSFNSTASTVAPSAITVYDYEAKRNATVRYRVRAKTSLIASAWSSATTVSVAATTQWAMAAFDSNDSAMAGTLTKTYLGVPVQNEMDVEIVESVGVFRPLGLSTSVVVHGALTGQDGRYSLIVSSTAARDSLLSVLNSQSTIMVSNPLNEIKYIRVVSRNFKLSGSTTVPKYEFDIAYIEVASGLSS